MNCLSKKLRNDAHSYLFSPAPSTLLATAEATKPNTEEEEDEEEEEVDVEAAMEDDEEEEEEEEEEESLHHVVDGGEAPGSPHIDSSASSYSSTNSSKGLLEAPATKAEPEASKWKEERLYGYVEVKTKEWKRGKPVLNEW